MKRTQIYLTLEEDQALERLARDRGRTKSQLIRDAIDAAYLGARHREALLQALNEAAGSWQRQESGAEYVERIRSGRLARVHGKA